MTTQQIETPASGPPLRSAQEAFQNHEDRMQALEAFGHLLGEAFPHLRDAAGLPRHPHQFTKDEMSGQVFDPNAGTIQSLQADNAMMKDMLTKILGRLPQLPEGNAEADAPTPGPAW
jgi:hypothetical protein